MLEVPAGSFAELRDDNVAVTKEVNIEVDMSTRLARVLDQYMLLSMSL